MFDDKTRVKLKWHLPALAHVLCLQRKKWYGWRTVSWIYPSIMKDETSKEILDWLLWDEKENTPSEKQHGQLILLRQTWQTISKAHT